MFNTSSIATDDENGNMLTGYQTAENALAEMLLHSALPQDAAESSPIGGLSVPVSSPLDSAESLQNILSATASPAGFRQ